MCSAGSAGIPTVGGLFTQLVPHYRDDGHPQGSTTIAGSDAAPGASGIGFSFLDLTKTHTEILNVNRSP